MPQIHIHDGRIKQQAVEQVEDAADAGEEVTRVFDAHSRLKSDSIKSPMTAVTLKMTPRRIGVPGVHPCQVAAEKMHEHQARAGRDDNRAAQNLPTFCRG